MRGKTVRASMGAAAACFMLGMAVAILPACSFDYGRSFTFNVSTGDSVKVSLDMTEGHNLGQDDGVFFVAEGGEVVLQGTWQTPDTAEGYLDALYDEDVPYDFVEVGDYTGVEWTSEGSGGTERNILIDLNGNTSVLIVSSDPAMDEALEKLTFEVV